ncbi:hypothetical protein [Mesorhizobium sp. ES1-1]|uniref:hypothetical protein n=1 Tax=Mesorhizobium sp. ES1-1 TaxID=2876629 RepID=UPI001CCF0911|nr:hypothetical protein [Mesorhizobium sp. ES1-1]MBZ9678241.1 hypothetical protein [Mesorhizobium sp. ES1-1]
MARTLVGRLQLVVEAMGLGEAKKVEGSMASIERTAKRLSSAPWGQSFERQLHKMAAGAREIEVVRRSWNSLLKDIAGRGLAAALKKSEISAWKTATLGEMAAVRSSMRQTEKEALRIGRALKGALRPAYVMAGGYTGAYMAGTWGREALNAASEAQRVRAEAKFSGLSGSEQTQITTRAEELSGKYRLALADVLGMLKETTLSMPSVDAALKVSDANARAQLILDTAFGSGAGAQGIRAFAKSMDLLERLDPDRYTSMLNGFVKMQQILGKDLDPEGYYQAVKYSRTGGKVGSDEFMSIYLPMMISEVGGSNAGNTIRAGFDQFVVGRASKKALGAQERYGLRSEDGKLLGQDEFGTNPIKWIYDVLLPQLEKKGVNTQDKIELARVVGELSSNRLSSDEVIGAILNKQQVFRYLDKRVPNAAGLSAADDVQNVNPFAAYSGFKDSLANLSDAVLPMESIGAGLNRFADYINAFTKKVREGDPAVIGGAGIAGAAIAAFGAWKVTTGIYALATAGPALNEAAAALTAAAVAQRGGVPGAGGSPAGGGAGWLSALGLTGTTGLWAMLVNGLGDTPGGTFDEQVNNQKLARQGLRRMLGLGSGRPTHFQEHERDDSLYGKMFVSPQRPGGIASMLNPPDPMQPILDGMDKVNSTTAAPKIDPSSIDEAAAKANALLATLRQIGAAASAAVSAVDAQMRRAHTDFGVVP